MEIRKYLLVGIAAVAFTACSETTEQTSSRKSAPKTETLTVYTWEDYADPGVFEAFTEKTGINVELVVCDSMEELIADIQSTPDRYDVVVADDITVSLLRELSLIRKLEHGKIPNLKNIAQRFRNLPFDRGNDYSVPYMWGSTLIAYRKDKIPNPDLSWSLLWDPQYRGKVMIVDEPQDVFGVPLLAAGRSADAEDNESINFAKERVMRQIREVDVKLAPYTEVLDKLQTGEIWAGMNYSGDVAMIVEDHPEIDFFIPREGALLWLDNFVISRDAKNVEAAHQFINYMSEAKVAAANSNYVWYATPNKAAEPFLDGELRGDGRIYPSPEVMEKCQFPTPSVQAGRENLLNLAMRDIRKLRRQKDQEKEGTEVTGVGEALK